MNTMNPVFIKNVAMAGMLGYLLGNTTWCLILMLAYMALTTILNFAKENY